MIEERYEVLVYYAPEEGDIERYGAPDEVRSCKTKAEAIADYSNVVHYYYKELMHYYNGVDGDCIMNDTNEYFEEIFTKALAFDAIYDWHSRMQLQGEGIAHNLDRMDWLLKNPTKKYEDYDKEMVE